MYSAWSLAVRNQDTRRVATPFECVSTSAFLLLVLEMWLLRALGVPFSPSFNGSFVVFSLLTCFAKLFRLDGLVASWHPLCLQIWKVRSSTLCPDTAFQKTFVAHLMNFVLKIKVSRSSLLHVSNPAHFRSHQEKPHEQSSKPLMNCFQLLSTRWRFLWWSVAMHYSSN